MIVFLLILFLFFFNDTATTEIYTLSLHDALPISFEGLLLMPIVIPEIMMGVAMLLFFVMIKDRKSTRLNSSHSQISYAVFCLKKKKKKSISAPSLSKRTTRRRLRCSAATEHHSFH